MPLKAKKLQIIQDYSEENYIHYNYPDFNMGPDEMDFENYEYYDSIMTRLKPDLNTMK